MFITYVASRDLLYNFVSIRLLLISMSFSNILMAVIRHVRWVNQPLTQSDLLGKVLPTRGKTYNFVGCANQNPQEISFDRLDTL